MGTTKRRSANGLGMAQPPAVHQNICRQLIEGLTKKLKANFKRNVSYETAIDGFVNKEEIAPDVVFFKDTYYPKGSKKLKSENPIFLIEVVKSDGVEYSTGNIERVFKRCPSLKEAFLYNYETERWFRYRRNGSTVESEPKETDYSQIFKMYLGSLLKVDLRRYELNEETFNYLKK